MSNNIDNKMSLELDQFNVLSVFCNRVCSEPKIRFCGIINSMGRLVTGSFKDNIQPLDTDEQRQMLYMQSKLAMSMEEEFDKNLGCVNHIVIYRDNVVMVNIPLKHKKYHVLISAENIADIGSIVVSVRSFFEHMLTLHQKA